MAVDYLSQNPFAVLSIVAAPAILTNASSVLALSTSNRFLRAGGLIAACLNLFRAARLSLLNISEEVALIRQRESQRV